MLSDPCWYGHAFEKFRYCLLYHSRSLLRFKIVWRVYAQFDFGTTSPKPKLVFAMLKSAEHSSVGRIYHHHDVGR